MHMLTRGVCVGVIAAAALTVVGGAPASAHTPSYVADCTKVEGRMASVPADFTSTITVTVGATTQAQTRDGDHAKSLPVPQAGATTAWRVTIDGEGTAYDRTWSGNVGPCGTPPPNYYLQTSHTVACGTATLTLRNVSPWIYPVSYSTDGSTPNANGPLYGPVVDNRGAAPDDQTGTKVLTFSEDTGVRTVKYVVAAGTEDDLYRDKPVGQVRTFTVDTDCEANVVETPLFPSPTPPTCDADGSLTVTPPDEALHSTTTVNGAPLTETTTYGPGSYVITHTADEGYEYGNDQTTASLTVTVDARLVDGCTPPPVPPTPVPPTPVPPTPVPPTPTPKDPKVNKVRAGINVGCYMAVVRLTVDKDDRGHRMVVTNQRGRVLLNRWIKPGSDRWYDVPNVRPGDTVTVTVKDKPRIRRSDSRPARGCNPGSE